MLWNKDSAANCEEILGYSILDMLEPKGLVRTRMAV